MKQCMSCFHQKPEVKVVKWFGTKLPICNGCRKLKAGR